MAGTCFCCCCSKRCYGCLLLPAPRPSWPACPETDSPSSPLLLLPHPPSSSPHVISLLPLLLLSLPPNLFLPQQAAATASLFSPALPPPHTRLPTQSAAVSLNSLSKLLNSFLLVQKTSRGIVKMEKREHKLSCSSALSSLQAPNEH